LFSFRGHTEGEAKAFLRKVAASAAIYVRDKMASAGASLQDYFFLGPDDCVSRSETISDSSVGENYLLLRQTIAHCLQRVVRGKNKSRNITIFKLAVFDGLSAKEIAIMPGFNAISSHAIEQLISRIRLKVRRCLQQ
jgi:DNA-directed RNA polymerase specialized sigma24 family protein